MGQRARHRLKHRVGHGAKSVWCRVYGTGVQGMGLGHMVQGIGLGHMVQGPGYGAGAHAHGPGYRDRAHGPEYRGGAHGPGYRDGAHGPGYRDRAHSHGSSPGPSPPPRLKHAGHPVHAFLGLTPSSPTSCMQGTLSMPSLASPTHAPPHACRAPCPCLPWPHPLLPHLMHAGPPVHAFLGPPPPPLACRAPCPCLPWPHPPHAPSHACRAPCPCLPCPRPSCRWWSVTRCCARTLSAAASA